MLMDIRLYVDAPLWESDGGYVGWCFRLYAKQGRINAWIDSLSTWKRGETA